MSCWHNRVKRCPSCLYFLKFSWFFQWYIIIIKRGIRHLGPKLSELHRANPRMFKGMSIAETGTVLCELETWLQGLLISLVQTVHLFFFYHLPPQNGWSWLTAAQHLWSILYFCFSKNSNKTLPSKPFDGVELLRRLHVLLQGVW